MEQTGVEAGASANGVGLVLRRAVMALTMAVASGVLFAGALPPQDVEAGGWIAFVPLLMAVRDPRVRPERALYRVGLGIVTGLVTGLVKVGIDPAAGANLQFAFLPYVWIALVLGVVAGAAGSNRLVRFDAGGIIWPLLVACAGVSVEWLTTFSPLPVGIALCQYRTLPVIQIADIFGIWGVSFLLYYVNAALADAFISLRWRNRSLILAAGLLALTLGYGVFRLHGAPGPTVRVAAIQDFSGADSAGFATVADSTPIPEKEDLIREAGRRGAKLIVGSEESWGAAFRPGDPTDTAAGLAREANATLVVGFSEPGAFLTDKPWNSAALVGPDGATLGIHHKIRLFLGERNTVQAGVGAHAYPTPLGRVGLLICFDSCYTNSARAAAADGARIIAMPNFDPPTPHEVLHNLHAALIPFRAVENRVAFVRADANGRSQIVDPDGRIVAETQMYCAEALVGDVHPGSGNGTFFTRMGDLLAYVCVGVMLASVLTPVSRATSGKARK